LVHETYHRTTKEKEQSVTFFLFYSLDCLLLVLTLQRTKASINDQFEIAQLALSEDDSGQLLCFGDELVMAGSITGQEIFQKATMGVIGHYCRSKKVLVWEIERERERERERKR
jgi:hypothetical protein